MNIIRKSITTTKEKLFRKHHVCKKSILGVYRHSTVTQLNKKSAKLNKNFKNAKSAVNRKRVCM